MKKLDEIMELMTDEMADFKAAIIRLEELSKQLSNFSIPISTEALDNNLNAFLEKQEEENRLKDDVLKEIEKKLKYARIIPNYLLILFCSLGLILLSLLGYFGYSLKERQNENFELYQILMETNNEKYQEYFSKKPEVQDDFKQWLKEKK
ncbi:hypothetical protein JM83_1568 [Gillisia sp. Hel_I_86]|uniref:DUF6730 family protein n=1 Tax=Gillisia sp. Hel_I_86 TaxID=1249981 RepID=UPI00119BDB2C|nr:DUF6730 family protein [Gillisia sp. Hel_I_86]TVZ26055.1 hypothetical protein JM83_1001 [Gillisia sp. Hel_I_86]TVZ26591.1 hypothetical protein JM83_1568 [Gillisia sp. Hel_I_86]